MRRHRGFRLDGEIDPRLSRAIKVSFTDSDIPASYQTFLVVDDFPTGLAWPGVADQIFALLNHFDGAGVDYTVHTRVRNRTDALAANTRALRQLSEQMDERSAEISYAQNFLVSRGQLLTAYNSHLEANPQKPRSSSARSSPSAPQLRRTDRPRPRRPTRLQRHPDQTRRPLRRAGRGLGRLPARLPATTGHR
ncbi:hypothetical protein I552_0500 [Mycobacterium xenopi 3993]|nr:hypothetical protein I552_0500 [Mycobacterium xenopi 3993]